MTFLSCMASCLWILCWVYWITMKGESVCSFSGLLYFYVISSFWESYRMVLKNSLPGCTSCKHMHPMRSVIHLCTHFSETLQNILQKSNPFTPTACQHFLRALTFSYVIRVQVSKLGNLPQIHDTLIHSLYLILLIVLIMLFLTLLPSASPSPGFGSSLILYFFWVHTVFLIPVQHHRCRSTCSPFCVSVTLKLDSHFSQSVICTFVQHREGNFTIVNSYLYKT